MTIHIGAEKSVIAETVLLPGDPYRAKWAAETFLEKPKLINEVRGMLGFTGTWKGNKVTIHGSGMGMPSISIYANELIKNYNVQTLIRIGSCGGMVEKVGIRDIVLAMSASSMSSMNKPIFKDLNFAATANWDLLNEAAKAAKKRNSKVHIGNIFSSDVFYSEHEDIDREMKRHGVLAVEMEAAELYTLAARYERRALAILTVSDHLITHEALPSKDRERSFGEMVEIALEAAFNETS